MINPNANSQVASIVFPTAGVYTVNLTVDNGTISTTSKTITVYAYPNLVITGFQPVMCEGDVVNLTASGGSYYSWLPGGTLSNTVSFVASGTTDYTCYATGPGNCKTNSAVSVESMDCTGIKENNVAGVLTVYPNPANSVLFLDVKGNAGRVVQVTDLTGRMMINQTLSSGSAIHTVEVSDLPPGVYFLNVEVNGKSQTVRFIRE